MTGRGGARRSSRSRRGGSDLLGIGRNGPVLTPVLAALGLLVTALLTLALFTGSVPLPGGGSRGGGGVVAGAARTPAPSNIVVVDPRVNIPGTLTYVKQGNLWVQSGNKAVQITSSGHGSMPSWSPDGRWIYYIETVQDTGYFPGAGNPPTHYLMDVPILTRVHPDGSGAEKLLSGRYVKGPYTWFFWLRQPRLSPDGRTVALLSDGPDPTTSDVVLQLFDLQTKKMRAGGVAENPPLGHQDPAWRPDGKVLLYVMNGRDGARGAPVIYGYDPATKKSTPLSGPGYMQPSWSPDGRWIAVTRTSNLGTDIAILDGKTGTEVLRLTSDERSWAPVWSPRGDAIAYMHLEGQIVDLRMIGLTGSGPGWTKGNLPDVTQYSGLDGVSGASWFIPGDQLPAPTATPSVPVPSVSGSSVP